MKPFFRWLAEWGLLFVLLVLAMGAATQSRNAPLLILLTAVAVIAINFSLPAALSSAGLMPVVAVSSLLAAGLPTAVTILLTSTLLAELSRPVWHSLWQFAPGERPLARQRLTATLIHLAALLSGAAVYAQYKGTAPLAAEGLANVNSFLALMTSFGLVYSGLMLLWWAAQSRPLSLFFRRAALPVVAAGLLALPFALLGGVTYALGGLPPFVVFCLGVAVFSIIVWLSWQRRHHLEQQLQQFAILNRSGDSLRETLELPQVLNRAHQLVTELVAVDDFVIFLKEEDAWRPYTVSSKQYTDNGGQAGDHPSLARPLDDFSQWVAAHGRSLHITPANVHFARQHQLIPPQPWPTVWLGLPMLLGHEVLGVMVLQRFSEARPFSPWHQELLRAVATQAGIAVHNARLHGEMVRLYNLTDEALAQRVRQLQALLNGMAEGVVMVSPAGQVMLVNPSAAHLLSENAPQPESPLPTAVAPALGYTPEALAQRLATLADGDQAPQGRVRYSSAQRTLERQESLVFDRGQQLIGWLLIFRDVTEETELAAQREDLTRMIVHDLRNPLTTIATTMQMAQDHLPPDGAITGLLQDAHMGSLDLLDMVDSLMDINRMEAGQSIVDADAMRLPPLMQKVASRLRPLLAHKQISLEITAPPDLPSIWADGELVRRVLVNLLDNALKFTPTHGRIACTMQPEPPADGYEPGIRCIIQDSGPGIPPHLREGAFDRYMRTNPGGAQIRGAGLGLTFCKMAVEAQHGRIWVEDDPGGGSQFVFTLPGLPITLSGDIP